MNKTYYVVTCPENGWDCVIGLYLAYSDEDIYNDICSEQYGENYTEDNMEYIKDRYIVHHKRLEEIFTKAEIRNSKIEKIINDGV